ncbi:McrC family protein [Vibrio sp. 2-Bac 85]
MLEKNGQQWIRLDSYVGVLESPCGQVIEILPKHHDEGDVEEFSRLLLRKLIASALDLPSREAEEAALSLYHTSLSEWVMHQFLLSLEHLLMKGIRFDYQRLEEEQRYLRGQLDFVKQMRQPPSRQHFFQIRHDVFLADRPENRLLRSALEVVCRTAQHSDNWRLARELLSQLQELPESRDTKSDFGLWRNDRLMAHYQSIKPWCELILYQYMPLAIAGDYRGISLLFPMERLFEQHVAKVLAHKLQHSATLRTQAASRYLCQHLGSPIFQLRPDLLIESGEKSWVLDTKWKRLDESDRQNKYGLSQGDLYQMLAYAREYLPEGKGEMVLIYPKNKYFQQPLAPFDFSHNLRLQIWPFDLDKDELLCSAETTLPLHCLSV